MKTRKSSYPMSKRTNWILTCTNDFIIPYPSRYVFEDGDYIPADYLVFKYKMQGVVSFNNHLHLFVKLSPVANQLLLYITQVMDPVTNEVHSDPSSRLHFIDFMKKHCGVIYKDRTVRSAYNQLTETGYLLVSNKAKRLIVNPLYFYRGTIMDREKLIRKLIYEATNPAQLNLDIKKKLGL